MAQRVEPTRTGFVLGALVVLVGIGLLATQVLLLVDQRRVIGQQLALQELLVDRSLPVLDDVRPVAEDAREHLPTTRRRLADAAALVRETRPLVRELRPLAREATPLVREARPLVREAAPLVREARPLVADLRTALAGERLGRALDAGLAALAEATRGDLLADADAAAEAVPQLLDTQRQTLALLRSTHDVLQQSLAVQRETLTHARSLDSKTGGPVPGSVSSGRRSP